VAPSTFLVTIFQQSTHEFVRHAIVVRHAIGGMDLGCSPSRLDLGCVDIVRHDAHVLMFEVLLLQGGTTHTGSLEEEPSL